MTDLHLYRRLLRYVKPYWQVFVLAVVGMFIVAGGEVIMLSLVAPLLQNFQEPDARMIVWLPLAIIASFILRGIGSYISDYGMAWTGNRVVFDLRAQMAEHLLRLPTRYYDDQSAGTVISKLSFDVQQLASAASHAITVGIRNSLTVLGMLAYLLYLDWRLTLLIFLTLPLVAWTIRYFSKRLRKNARAVQEQTGELTQVLEEMVSGHRIVKIFDGSGYEAARTRQVADRLRHVMSKQASATSMTNPITQLLAAAAVGLIIFFALKQVGGRMAAEEFITYVVALLRLLDQIKGITNINALLQRGLAAAESVFGLLDQPAEIDEGTIELGRTKGELNFDRVSFRYNDSAAPALTDLSLTIRSGETIALVGPSGAGKTSLVNLLPRFYSYQEGRILLDGHDLRSIKLASLRRNIALVSQEVVLFNDTIAANIAYGALAETAPEQIKSAAKAAHALEFIEQLPEGFATLVGENGVKLSGGQRQRIAIARALLKNAPILILDEATSALDSESERHVQAALETLMQNRTTIVIAHRLSTIEKADRIVVLQRGRIAEIGNHAELLAKEGLYAKLYRIQFAEQGTKA